MTQRVDVLVLSAHPSELSALSVAEARFARGGCVVATASVGVGMPAAAAGTARALHTTKPRAAVLLGSCGSFEPWPILSLTVATRARLLDAAELDGRAAHPDAMTTTLELDAGLADAMARALPSARRAVVGTTLGITTDDALAGELGRTGCDVENMEALAVAIACREADVPLAMLLVTTNRVGGRGRAEWASNHRQAARVGADALRAWLDAGAPGLAS